MIYVRAKLISFRPWCSTCGVVSAWLVERSSSVLSAIVGDAQGWAKIHRATLVRQRISVALLRGVAEQLLRWYRAPEMSFEFKGMASISV